jgi:hypothetical protein
VKSREVKASIVIGFVCRGDGEGCRGCVKKTLELEKKDEGGLCTSGYVMASLYTHRACPVGIRQ